MTDAVVRPSDQYFGDWTVGDVFETEGSYVMTAERMVEFANEFDPQIFHTDPVAAKESVFGGLIASGWHSGSAMMRLLTEFLGPSSLGSPGVDELRWLEPVRPGDELRVRLTVLETRPSSSKPDRGLVRCSEELFRKDGTVVMSQVATLICARRPELLT